jgi:hypothetical protein
VPTSAASFSYQISLPLLRRGTPRVKTMRRQILQGPNAIVTAVLDTARLTGEWLLCNTLNINGVYAKKPGQSIPYIGLLDLYVLGIMDGFLCWITVGS